MADRYWVGGTASWDETAGSKWAATSGGAGGASVPTSADNVIFDAASGAGTCTTSASAVCLALTCTGYTGTLSIAAGNSLSAYGNITLAAGMTMAGTGTVSLAGTGTQTITSNGRAFRGLTINNGATLSPADELKVYTSLTNNGTFTHNSQTVRVYSGCTISGAFTGSNQFNNLTLNFYSSIVSNTDTAQTGFVLAANITVVGALATSGGAVGNGRNYLRSDVTGTQRTITANGTISVTYLDIEDISGAGTASWDLSAITGLSGNCGGNTGITFTTAINCYVVMGSATDRSFATGTNIWFTTSGGATVARIPLPQDAAIIDVNSVTATGKTIRIDQYRMGSQNYSAAATAFTLRFSESGILETRIFGGFVGGTVYTMTSGPSFYWIFKSRANKTLSGRFPVSARIDAPGYIFTVGDNNFDPLDITVNAGTLSLGSASISPSDVDLNGGTLSLGSGTLTLSGATNNDLIANGGTLDFGSGTLTSASQNVTITINSGCTIVPGTGTIKCSSTGSATFTLSAAGKTYNNFWHAGTTSGNVTINGGATFSAVTVDPGKTLKLQAGNTLTATTWNISGSSGNNVTLTSSTSAQHTLAKAGGGTVNASYITVSYSNATPSSTFYALQNATNGGNNSGWIFSMPSNLFFGSHL